MVAVSVDLLAKVTSHQVFACHDSLGGYRLSFMRGCIIIFFEQFFYWSFIKWILRFGAVLALETNDLCHYVCVLVMSSCSRVNQCVQSTWSLKFHAQAIRGHISPKSHKVSDRMLCTTHPVTLYGRCVHQSCLFYICVYFCDHRRHLSSDIQSYHSVRLVSNKACPRISRSFSSFVVTSHTLMKWLCPFMSFSTPLPIALFCPTKTAPDRN